MVGNRYHFLYGSNPGQSGSVGSGNGFAFPLRAEAGTLSYNNMLDAVRALAIARRLSLLTGGPAAASVKNGLPVGAALVADTEPASAETLARAARFARPDGAVNDCVAMTCEIDAPEAQALGSMGLDVVVVPRISGGIRPDTRCRTRTRFATVNMVAFDRLQHVARPVHQHYGLFFEEDREALVNDRTLGLLGGLTEAGPGPVVLAVAAVENTLHRALAASAGDRVVACVGAAQTESGAVSELCDRLDQLDREMWGEAIVVASGVNLSQDGIASLGAAGVACVLQPDGSSAGAHPPVYATQQRLIRRW
ncbi:hypothetical protein [Nonomuraea sp. NPDC048901]|uniref:hypothetical protein n=1 Tax=Nonomuraea sp. NPDC048901 TaxID=3155627 RepID=UPI0033E3EBD1